jgi:hypothetical protein
VRQIEEDEASNKNARDIKRARKKKRIVHNHGAKITWFEKACNFMKFDTG